jgi:hypothetical protein
MRDQTECEELDELIVSNRKLEAVSLLRRQRGLSLERATEPSPRGQTGFQVLRRAPKSAHERVQRSGASRSARGKNRTSPAAGSRRSP